jgi:hypothetical protein
MFNKKEVPMKNTTLRIVLLLTLCLMLAQTASAKPRRARRINTDKMAEKYLERLEKQVDRYCKRLDRATTRCVDFLYMLLLNGEEEEAAQIAEDAVSWIERSSRMRINIITWQSRNLANLLRRFDADNLADDVLDAAGQAITTIQNDAEDAVQAIISLFGGGGDEYAE